eukprot:CAMPEP_0177660906 /NCGR_PEP_ID=MMETSP0447-20121125/18337_1 /TAXON_ID=0 /ORGANISM="Stygamoeba regulata, Strain BSH-02190019" /LENGTH=133 /DNA_ID=CAMNT_0019166097 /DNA_START=38 /DNA_END=439 /DNA_ORIENTATION=-
MAFTGETEAERLEREQARISRHVDAKANTEPAEPKAVCPTEWIIALKGFPPPVTLLVGGEEIFNSPSEATEDVDTVCKVAPKNLTGNDDFTLKIPAMEFENTRKFKFNDGAYVKFEFTEQGLRIGQSNAPHAS